LFIDTGFSPAEVAARVQVGDRVQLVGPLTRLQEDRLASKTMDDRACVAAMLLAAERLAQTNHAADLYFVCAGQEETSSYGAKTSCYAIDPDMAIALDVTHGAMPDCPPDEVFPLDKVVLSKGPNLHPRMVEALQSVAKAEKVDTKLSITPHVTWTDASVLQVCRAGVPTALIELPLKYMHTTVETCSAVTLRECGRLLAAYLGALGADWRDDLCL
jgi:endoglucanase